MSGMNPWLAQIYGTDGADDLEKTAQNHLLQKLAEEQNIDLSQFSPEELQALLQEVMGEQVMQQGQQAQPQVNTQNPQALGLPAGTDMNPTQMGQQQRPQGQHPAMAQAFAQQPQVPQGMPQQAMQAQQGGQDMAAMQKEAQAKFEEADLLGRVMAHAYTQELEKIAATKTASARPMQKRASANRGPAFMKLAEMHAADILGAAGFDPATGNDQWASQQTQQAPEQTQQTHTQQVQAPQQTQQAPQGQAGQVEQQAQGGQGEQFAAQLDETALNMLAEAGYDVNEILARIQYAQQGQQGQA